MSDLFQMMKFAFAGITNFPALPSNTIKAGGRVFYHFLNVGEEDTEKVDSFIAQFKPESQEIIEYKQEDLNDIIVGFEYQTTDVVNIVPYNRVKFAKFENYCLTKYKFNFEKNGRTYYNIMVIEATPIKKKSTIKFKLIVHTYLNSEIRDQKFTEISDDVYLNQFNGI